MELVVFDVFGKQVAALANSIQPAGEYEISFNAKNLNNGTYFYKLSAGNNSITRKFQVFR